ncbi:hypothetical protein G6011_04645 [Alternaria panax]|uniref:Uncharacterized protein n=1 Tax=Alternaria panax TaxID=48097 RepID=A0AAD4IH87_9PLEO|nr:hypothetical protein G6011_04645 [Alternaria panax]
MSAPPTPSLLDASACAFSPGQSAHPSPAPSERFSSPSPPLSAVKFQSQFQLQPQQYLGPQKQYGYQPFPIFNGYTQAYEFQATPPPYSPQPEGAASWYPQQNGHVGYTIDSHEPFADQFTELQGVRDGHIPSQKTWYHDGTGNYFNNYNNDAPKNNAKKNKRKKFNRLNKAQDRAEEQNGEPSTQAEPKPKTGAKKQTAGQQNEPKNKTKVRTDMGPETKAESIIGG